MIRNISTIFILLSLCCCSKKGADAFHDVKADTTILSDPYRTFMPDIYESIESNDIYKEWRLNGVFKNLIVEKRMLPGQEDSVIFVGSGVNGLDMLLDVPMQLLLPEKSKTMELNIIYTYQGHADAKMTLRTCFFTHNTLAGEFVDKLPSVPETNDDEKTTEDSDVLTAKYTYRIPRGADNVQISLNSFDRKIFEDAWFNENLTDSMIMTDCGFVSLGLNRFEIKINHKNMEEYVYNHHHPFREEELKAVSEKITDSIGIDGKVKILGIGETVHGCAAFSKQMSELVKRLVENGFNRIGLETPILAGMLINDYVHGAPLTLDSVLSQGKINYVNNAAFRELFDFIKTYNQETDEKILVFGFDRHSDQDIDAIEAYVKAGVQDSLYAGYLLNYIEKYGKGYKNNVLRHIMERKRDRIMSDNIMYIADRAADGEKTVLMAHIGHLSRRKLPKPASAGSYLSEKYGDAYAVAGLYVGGGTFYSHQVCGFDIKRTIKHFPLSKPIGKSLEQLCLLMDRKEFYINDIRSLKPLDKILYARYIGNSYGVMQFDPVDLRKEVDVVWFTAESGDEVRYYF